MPVIKFQIFVKADRKLVFDLARSIDLHMVSTAHTEEKAVAGKTSGLIGLHETVTWRARHFGIYQTLTARITGLNYPESFTDEMVSGAFKKFRHEHHFQEHEEGTLMTDTFNYVSPFGVLGKIADVLFLKKYMADFLKKRNRIIKKYAESGKWREILKAV